MRRGTTLFLKATICAMALAALAFCGLVLMPAIVSGDAGYYLPVAMLMIVSVAPFFVALYQGFQLLRFIDRNAAFSERSVRALRMITYAALAISALYAAGMPYTYYAANRDDAPGVILLGLIVIGASLVIAVFSGVLQHLLRNAIAIQSENDLTV